MHKIGIINYSTGNIASITNVLDFLGSRYKIIVEKRDFKNIDKIILPGVGNFDYAMKKLNKTDLKSSLKDFHKSQGVIFGICLGMQILLKSSEESRKKQGLNFLKGKVVAIDSGKCNPKFGWLRVFNYQNNKIFNIKTNGYFYFAHSYKCVFSKKYFMSHSVYKNKKIVASVEHKNIFGCQFHPELSGENGLKIYRNFINY